MTLKIHQMSSNKLKKFKQKTKSIENDQFWCYYHLRYEISISLFNLTDTIIKCNCPNKKLTSNCSNTFNLILFFIFKIVIFLEIIQFLENFIKIYREITYFNAICLHYLIELSKQQIRKPQISFSEVEWTTFS